MSSPTLVDQSADPLWIRAIRRYVEDFAQLKRNQPPIGVQIIHGWDRTPPNPPLLESLRDRRLAREICTCYQSLHGRDVVIYTCDLDVHNGRSESLARFEPLCQQAGRIMKDLPAGWYPRIDRFPSETFEERDDFLRWLWVVFDVAADVPKGHGLQVDRYAWDVTDDGVQRKATLDALRSAHSGPLIGQAIDETSSRTVKAFTPIAQSIGWPAPWFACIDDMADASAAVCEVILRVATEQPHHDEETRQSLLSDTAIPQLLQDIDEFIRLLSAGRWAMGDGRWAMGDGRWAVPVRECAKKITERLASVYRVARGHDAWLGQSYFNDPEFHPLWRLFRQTSLAWQLSEEDPVFPDVMSEVVEQIRQLHGAASKCSELAKKLATASAENKPPLSQAEEDVYELLRELRVGKGLTGGEIVALLKKKGRKMKESTLTTHVIPKLKRHYGIENRRNVGYFIREDAR